MSEKATVSKKFENDIALLRESFYEFLRSISHHERRLNFRLKQKARFAIRQLGLCRELARSLDEQI